MVSVVIFMMHLKQQIIASEYNYGMPSNLMKY